MNAGFHGCETNTLNHWAISPNLCGHLNFKPYINVCCCFCIISNRVIITNRHYHSQWSEAENSRIRWNESKLKMACDLKAFAFLANVSFKETDNPGLRNLFVVTDLKKKNSSYICWNRLWLLLLNGRPVSSGLAQLCLHSLLKLGKIWLLGGRICCSGVISGKRSSQKYVCSNQMTCVLSFAVTIIVTTEAYADSHDESGSNYHQKDITMHK